MNARQTYSIYRDKELIAAGMPSLEASRVVAKNDARNEHAHGRAAQYLITGSLGFRRSGCHHKGRLRWEHGKLTLGTVHDTEGCI